MTGALLAASSAASSASATAAATASTTDAIASKIDASASAAETLQCTPGDGTFCSLMVRAGADETLARFLTYYGAPLLRVLVMVVVGLLLRRLLHRAIGVLSERIADGESPGQPRWWRAGSGRDARASEASTARADGTLAWERRAQRARTLGSVLRSLTTAVVFSVVGLLVLGQVGIDLAPLLAGAGVIGVAVGFGAQTLVKDFLSGIFLIAEDQYGVGDSVTLSVDAVGTVEAVGLRVTRLRGVDGTVWYVRNGDVLRVGNRSQGWSRAVLDVDVPFTADAAAVAVMLDEVGRQLHAEEEWRAHLLEEPQVWGVEALTLDKVVVRLAVRTAPLQQWAVARELRARIKARFDAEGVGHPVSTAEAPPVVAAG